MSSQVDPFVIQIHTRLHAGELFVRTLLRRVALRVAEEAGQPPAAQRRGAVLQMQQQQHSGQDSSRWLGDAIAASPLWLLLPRDALGFPQPSYPMTKVRKDTS